MKAFKNRNSWSKSGQSFVSFTDASGKITRKDIIEAERLDRVHKEADETELESRERWTMDQDGLNQKFDISWLDKEFEHRGTVYKIVGVMVVKKDPLIICRSGDSFARMGVPFIAAQMAGIQIAA